MPLNRITMNWIRPNLVRKRFRNTGAIACVLACSLLGFGASSQDQSAATAKDVIVARKTLMNSVMEKMDRIGDMISQRKIDVYTARQHADDISVMLMALPHLFPPESNQWKEDVQLDPAADTIASPDIWSDFADFYRRAGIAANTAYELSRTDSEDDVKRLYRALGVACDTCHSLYLKE
jgi:cytochrome c556